MSSKEIKEKIIKDIDKLPENSLKEIMDFVSFKLSKTASIEISEYKKRILNVSVWSDSDIDIITKAQKKLNQWEIQEW